MREREGGRDGEENEKNEDDMHILTWTRSILLSTSLVLVRSDISSCITCII